MSQVSAMNISRKINDIVEFALSYSGYYNGVERDELIKYAELHELYGTLYWLPGVAFARWNILPSKNVMHLIDLIIHPDYRSISMIRFIALEIWKQNPKIESFYYDRLKSGERSSYGYSVKHWFKLRNQQKEITRHGRQVL